MVTDRRLIFLSIWFAVLLVGARLTILLQYSAGVSSDYLLSLLISLANEFVIGLIISFGLFKLKKGIALSFYLIAAIFVIAYKLACFHYESVFSRLPGSELFYYVSELSHLGSSLDSNIPAFSFLIEIIVVCGLYFLLVYYLINRTSGIPKQSRGMEWLTFFALLVCIISQTVPKMIPDRFFWGSREALIWMIQSQFIKERYELDKMQLLEKDFQRFLQYHGKAATALVPDPEYPLCRFTHKDIEGGVKRNAILLILEGVGKYEIDRVIDGKLMMPNLKRIASENISFNNVIAPGTRSAQALTAIFSGLPAQPFNNYLWVDPMLKFNGFPKTLAASGYTTAYFHGSDLAFENQRLYLQEIGFNEIHEYDPEKPYKVYGWGYDDGVMFGELRRWIENHQRHQAAKPYFASMFTLSTHDPYVLPVDWQPRFSNKTRVMPNAADWSLIEGDSNIISGFAESYAFLDHYLGQFYNWYKANEPETLLIITSDHAPHLFNDGNDIESRGIQFTVPFIVAGLADAEKAEYQSYQNRSGALNDIPATLMGMLDQKDHECDLGVNLLSPEKNWPKDRYLYAMGGNNLEGMFIRHNNSEILYDRVRKEFRSVVRKANTDTEISTMNAVSDDLLEFYSTINSVHYYLLHKDAYFRHGGKDKHGVKDKVDDQILPDVEDAIFVSHRGNLDGPGDLKNENSRQSLDAVVASDMDWVEIDVQVTRDGVPILMHDATVEIGGESRYIDTLTFPELLAVDGYADVLTLQEAVSLYTPYLNLLIEIKPPREISKTLHIIREVAKIVRNKPAGKKIIVDSFQSAIVSSVKQHCQCEVGFDTPYGEKVTVEALQQYKRSGIDWIYVHYSVVDETLINNAHANGLRVMAYTVNTPEIIEAWKSHQMPDGIITDDIRIMQQFDMANADGR